MNYGWCLRTSFGASPGMAVGRSFKQMLAYAAVRRKPLSQADNIPPYVRNCMSRHPIYGFAT